MFKHEFPTTKDLLQTAQVHVEKAIDCLGAASTNQELYGAKGREIEAHLKSLRSLLVSGPYSEIGSIKTIIEDADSSGVWLGTPHMVVVKVNS